MTAYNEIIEKLPEELQPLADVYLPIFADMAEDEVNALIDNIVEGDCLSAYNSMFTRMSTPQIATMIERINDRMVALNKASAQAVEMQRQFAKDALAIGLLALKERIGV